MSKNAELNIISRICTQILPILFYISGRIENDVCDDPEDYEAVTSLAGKAREHLIHGGKLPVTSGFLII